jgi:hypothetical protein
MQYQHRIRIKEVRRNSEIVQAKNALGTAGFDVGLHRSTA